MSTSGEVVSTSPTRWSLDATMFTTPGGMSVCSAMRRPRRVAFHGVSGAGFSTHVLPMASTGPSLFRMISIGKFHGTITPTTPMGSFHTSRSVSAHAEGVLAAERAAPRERLDLFGRPGEGLAERGVELRSVGDEHRATDLGDQLGAQLLLLRLDGGLELEQAPLAEGVVGGPGGGVERPPGGGDGGLHVGGGAVGDAPSTSSVAGLMLSNVAASLGLDQLAVDQQPSFADVTRPAPGCRRTEVPASSGAARPSGRR